MRKILIVGQGIAGTMLAWALRRKNARVHISDGNLAGSSSPVAAGVINPVTGKRFVKTWRFDEFFDAARSAYRSLEQELGIKIWSEQPVVRLLATAEEANDWSARCALPDYAGHMAEITDAGDWSPHIKPGWRLGLLREAARVNFAELITTFRKNTGSGLEFRPETFDYQNIDRELMEYDQIVFCEGFRAVENPFFPGLPWQPAKGEALLIRLREGPKSVRIHQMLKKTVTLVPLDENLFWAGGSYQWYYPDTEPSAGERDYILNHLFEMLSAPFDIVGHVAGIRPTVKDRRPFIGQSRIRDNIFIFNGLGTKGALLAPYWAGHLADHLMDGKPLDPAVDIRRFVMGG
ncbi:MAG: FAD-binding oxidoreductase [Lewinellaceae bacterium]|nr:FAD-binding oxidoreductase [Lewinellaceae bacterium]